MCMNFAYSNKLHRHINIDLTHAHTDTSLQKNAQDLNHNNNNNILTPRSAVSMMLLPRVCYLHGGNLHQARLGNRAAAADVYHGV